MNVYEIVTERILQQLEKGVVPWHKPWIYKSSNIPINYVTRKPYRGVNLFLLDKPGEWLTWNQIQKLKGTVRKGEKSSLVVFFSYVKPKDDSDADESSAEPDPFSRSEQGYPLLKYTRVWHLSQVDGIESKLSDAEDVESSLEHNEMADSLITSYCEAEGVLLDVDVHSCAFYSPSEDLIQLPELSQYTDLAEYYSTAFHELAHSTGAPSRLNRKLSSAKHKGNYAKEELIAEIASAFITSNLGLDVSKSFDNSVAYISHWSKCLAEDNRLIVSASSKAAQAADYILKYNTEESL